MVVKRGDDKRGVSMETVTDYLRQKRQSSTLNDVQVFVRDLKISSHGVP